MNILAIDTTAGAISLALLYDDRYSQRYLEVGFSHVQQLLPSIKNLFSDLNIDSPHIDLVTCVSGPGSFTGLRVGVSSARGLSLAWGCPMVLVSSLWVYGQGDPDKVYMPCFDAKKDRFYVALSQNGVLISNEMDATPQQIIKEVQIYEKVWLTGPGAKELMHVIQLPANVELENEATRCRGKFAIELGKRQFLQEGPASDYAGPHYLRASDAQISGPTHHH
ncbi:MAG: tRNA (adenosine(37)-N6)-threonylcarbamoyltransferase complex dimerization subunit type 1 TsaB [Spirochaetia bacterium]